MPKLQNALNNKFGGVNQRVLKTDSLDFSVFNGCFPFQMGIQQRIYGKNIIGKFDNPVQAIFQFYTPQGYVNGIFQTDDNVSIAPWQLPPWNFPVDGGGQIIPPISIPVGSNGNINGDMSGSYDGGTGLGGGSKRYEVVSTDHDIGDFVTDFVYLTGSYENPVVIPLPNFQPYPPLDYLDLIDIEATVSITPPDNDIVASKDKASVNGIFNNQAPPPNQIQIQNQTTDAIDTTFTLDLSSLVDENVIFIAIKAVVNGVTAIIPFNQSFESIQETPTFEIRTSDYLIDNTIVQVAFNFNAFGNRVSVPPDTGYGMYGMADRNQSQNNTIEMLQIRVYTCHLTPT